MAVEVTSPPDYIQEDVIDLEIMVPSGLCRFTLREHQGDSWREDATHISVVWNKTQLRFNQSRSDYMSVAADHPYAGEEAKDRSRGDSRGPCGMTPTFPEMTGGTKRMVLEYTTGPFKGLRQIVGTTDALPAGSGLPTFCDGIEFHGHRCAVNLLRVTNRTVRYRELTIPTLAQTLDPRQQ